MCISSRMPTAHFMGACGASGGKGPNFVWVGAVVDRVHANVLHLVPADLAAPRLGRVHNVVRDQKVGLQPLDAPAEGGGTPLLLWRRVTFDGLRHGGQAQSRWRRCGGGGAAVAKAAQAAAAQVAVRQRTSIASTTVRPRLSFPLGTLYSTSRAMCDATLLGSGGWHVSTSATSSAVSSLHTARKSSRALPEPFQRGKP